MKVTLEIDNVDTVRDNLADLCCWWEGFKMALKLNPDVDHYIVAQNGIDAARDLNAAIKDAINKKLKYPEVHRQESFTEDDMIRFGIWCKANKYGNAFVEQGKLYKEFLKDWLDKKPPATLEMTFSESDLINFIQWDNKFQLGDDNTYSERRCKQIIKNWMKQHPEEKTFDEVLCEKEAGESRINAFKAWHIQEQERIGLMNRPKFKAGDWVWNDLSMNAFLCVDKLPEAKSTYEIYLRELNAWGEYNSRIAFDSEIESSLIAEAERRGYKQGRFLFNPNGEDAFLEGEIRYLPNQIYLDGHFGYLLFGKHIIWKEHKNEWSKLVENSPDKFSVNFTVTSKNPDKNNLNLEVTMVNGIKNIHEFYNDFEDLLRRHVQ